MKLTKTLSKKLNKHNKVSNPSFKTDSFKGCSNVSLENKIYKSQIIEKEPNLEEDSAL